MQVLAGFPAGHNNTCTQDAKWSDYSGVPAKGQLKVSGEWSTCLYKLLTIF
jgi:hypothetical protein